VGLEPEMFAFRAEGPDGLPERVLLEGPGGVLERIEALVRRGVLQREPGVPPRFRLLDGGHLTFEPGGQVEHSTRPHDTAAGALGDVETTVGLLLGALRPAGITLASLGIDLWHDAASVPQQLDAPRYRCMAAYFDARGPWGRVMMRNTASLQVNLDLGPPAVARERYRVLNLAGPLATAIFASSPADGHASLRGRAWQELDPTRTGFPRGLIEADGADPGVQYAQFALDADVLLFRADEDARIPEAHVGLPGFRFRDWIEHGHPDHGWPTALDLGYHLTTLFPEVRLRNFFEIRSGDALPSRWRPVPVVLWSALAYDPTARRQALDLLDPLHASLPDLWSRSTRRGLADPELASLARQLWPLALAGAARLPEGFLRPSDIERTRVYLERFTLQGRAPGDELAEECGASPSCGLRWAGEEVSDEGVSDGDRARAACS
jgi:glutamate--cysteine ligase